MSDMRENNETEVTDSAPIAAEETIASLEEQVRVHQKQVAQIRQAHTEAAAEFTKTRDRLRRVHASEIERSRLDMAKALFDVWDNLQRSLESARSGTSRESLIEGVSLVSGQFRTALQTFGVTEMSPIGEPFTPERHEAIGVLPVDDERLDNRVVLVLKPGFLAADKVLRAALVQVGRYQAPPKTEEPAASNGSSQEEV